MTTTITHERADNPVGAHSCAPAAPERARKRECRAERGANTPARFAGGGRTGVRPYEYDQQPHGEHDVEPAGEPVTGGSSSSSSHITPGFGSEVLYVKWSTPVEELRSTARLADALVDRRIAAANEVCIAVPNRNWAAQLLRVCDELGIQIIDCFPQRLGAAARLVLAKLDVAAGAPDALEVWAVLGGSEEQARELADALYGVRGHSLTRAVGANQVPELAHALRHVVGHEDAAQVACIIREQAKRPTVPEGRQLISIAHYQHVNGEFPYLFMVGCVDGLIPGAAALEADGEQERAAALAAARAAYHALVDAPRMRTVLSGFTRASVELADAARIPYARTKMERGVKLAMTAPSRFLTEEGAARPSTEGGQALLKKYRLN